MSAALTARMRITEKMCALIQFGLENDTWTDATDRAFKKLAKLHDRVCSGQPVNVRVPS